MGLIVHLLLTLQIVVGILTRLRYFVHRLRRAHQMYAASKNYRVTIWSACFSLGIILGLSVALTIALGINHFNGEASTNGSFSGWIVNLITAISIGFFPLIFRFLFRFSLCIYFLLEFPLCIWRRWSVEPKRQLVAHQQSRKRICSQSLVHQQ